MGLIDEIIGGGGKDPKFPHAPAGWTSALAVEAARREVLIAAGLLRAKALAVTTPKRSPALPEVPAIAEFVPGYAMFGWYSIVVPGGAPSAILNKVSAEVVRAAKEPAFGERLKVLGIGIVGGNREELDAFRRSERKRISELVKASGVSIQ